MRDKIEIAHDGLILIASHKNMSDDLYKEIGFYFDRGGYLQVIVRGSLYHRVIEANLDKQL